MRHCYLKKLSVLCCLLFFVGTADARLYRWVDENGKVHYSDQLPPEQSKQGHEILSDEGRKLKEVAPEKSREQLLKERREQAKIDQEEERRRIIRERDEMLLRTFTTVEDLDRVINDRITVLNSIIHLTEFKLEKLQAQLDKTKQRKISYIKAGKSVPEQVEKNIVEYQLQISNNEGLIQRNERRKELITQKFELDRKRYLELVELRKRNREAAKEF